MVRTMAWFMIYLHSRLLSRLRRRVGLFNTELLGVFRDQPRPAELHGVSAGDASNRLTREQAIQNVEADMPACGAPRDEAAIDVVPQGEARAGTKGFEFPPLIAVLKHLWKVDSRNSCFDRLGVSHPGELHRGSNLIQTPIDIEGSPLAQMRWVGKRLPDFFRRVAQFSNENERPPLSVLSYLRSAGWTRCVLLAMVHLLLLNVHSVPAG